MRVPTRGRLPWLRLPWLLLPLLLLLLLLSALPLLLLRLLLVHAQTARDKKRGGRRARHGRAHHRSSRVQGR